MNENQNKKSSSWVLIVGIVVAVLACIGDFNIKGVGISVVGLLVLFAPVIIIVALVRLAAGKNKKSTSHTHDRIDHSSDLKIDSRTGKAMSTQRTVVQHSAREHWKEQLDTLLANGTIDRKEYREMMNRKF